MRDEAAWRDASHQVRSVLSNDVFWTVSVLSMHTFRSYEYNSRFPNYPTCLLTEIAQLNST